jgi:peptide/nickel transport system substrate-binding protein
LAGVRQLVQNVTVDQLVRMSETGRPEPVLAESWHLSTNQSLLDIQLRRGVKFHDGSDLSASIVAEILKTSLPAALGPASDDVEGISAISERDVRITLRRPSPFVLESLEAPILKPNSQTDGTGPFMNASFNGQIEMRRNTSYFGGPPSIDRIVVHAYPSIRGAWAELLRGNVDMLYEVGVDALDSLEGSKTVTTFNFIRHYQYLIALNQRAPVLAPSEIRRALNEAIDRREIIRDGLGGHGLISSGPIWPLHWALAQQTLGFDFKPQQAAKITAQKQIQFTCLVPSEPSYERIALIVKRQLAAVGIEMAVKEASQQAILDAINRREFEAVLFDPVSGPTLFRLYQWWHTGGPLNLAALGSSDLDEALDKVRHSTSDNEYRAAVAALQQEVLANPPAIFLAWGERARAVSRRFEVPTPEKGRDVLATLRLWRPSTDPRYAGRN